MVGHGRSGRAAAGPCPAVAFKRVPWAKRGSPSLAKGYIDPSCAAKAQSSKCGENSLLGLFGHTQP
jgi:hypothetical protein